MTNKKAVENVNENTDEMIKITIQEICGCKNSYQYDEEYDEVIEEYEEDLPVTLDDWMHYNGLSWSDFI